MFWGIMVITTTYTGYYWVIYQQTCCPTMVIIPWWRRVCAAHFEHHWIQSLLEISLIFVVYPLLGESRPGLSLPSALTQWRTRGPRLVEEPWRVGNDFFGIGLVIHTTLKGYIPLENGSSFLYGICFFFPKKTRGSIWRCPSSVA